LSILLEEALRRLRFESSTPGSTVPRGEEGDWRFVKRSMVTRFL
jgi:hypothetical protein